MNDDAVRELATRAGIAVQWIDYADQPRRVSLDTLRRILLALGLPCQTASDLSHSRLLLDAVQMPGLITASVGEPIDLPVGITKDLTAVRLVREDGTTTELAMRRTEHGTSLPGIRAPRLSQHRHRATRVALAIAPERCVAIEDIVPGKRVAGLAAQTYALRSAGDCGIGDMSGVSALAASAAALKIDALALSPLHALFTSDPSSFSPYSPSNRLFYNPLHGAAALVFGAARLARARVAAGIGTAERETEASALINWSISGGAKLSVFRCLFDDFATIDLAANPATALAADFAQFRVERGTPLEQHAIFEALHGARLQAEREAWNWRTWSAEWRDPGSATVRSFAERNQSEVLFHMFLQWVADRSLAAAQHSAKQAGMQIGLISDLAVGMNGAGSHAWTNQAAILGGLEIGAPPDLFNANGQNWGLTTFSPRALAASGYEPFITTLRVCMRHAGGVRIDHAMGFMRLWVTPQGARPNEGAYLTYPLDDLLRLTALESHRHRAIVIGEDLGTVPAGFRDRLAQAGIYGMSILWFERDGRRFKAPRDWPARAVAMTSTHDLAPIAAWCARQRSRRARNNGLASAMRKIERTSRRKDREALWTAFTAADVDAGKLPPADDTARIADDAVKFIAQTPSPLALLPLEDALALSAQPNLPGTIDEHPNWRRRYDLDAAALLDAPVVRRRMQSLSKRGAS